MAVDLPVFWIGDALVAATPTLSIFSLIVGAVVSWLGIKGFVPGLVFGPIFIGLGGWGLFDAGWVNFV